MNVLEQLKKLGYSTKETSRSKGNNIVVTELTTDRRSEIENLSKLLGGVLDRSALALRESSAGRIKVAGKTIYIKPGAKSKGAKETLGIQATTLIRAGHTENYEWSGMEFRAKTFTDANRLHSSIVSGLKSNNNVSPQIVEFVDNLLSRGNFNSFTWPADIHETEKNQLGKYLGELLLGFLALEHKHSFFHPNPFHPQAKKFILPDDPSFSGIDSVVELNDGSLIPVSSKFGQGANASFFANILPKGLQYHSKLKPSVFKDIVDLTRAMGISQPEKNGKQILFEYGIREILGLNKVQIHDTFAVYKALYNGQLMDTQVATTVGTLRERGGIAPVVLDQLPHSLGGWFAREIADRLNADPASMEAMKGILAGKDFYQANLNIAAWNKGKIDFKMVRTTNISLKIAGNKSVLKDVSMKQGIINYELRIG